LRFQSSAIGALQEAAEAYLVSLFEGKRKIHMIYGKKKYEHELTPISTRKSCVNRY
jgi:hypothetical protein